jgi:Zn-dependent peptidase ImmA (M78 family)/transcriptional regulator with XRE-family HTH domain
MIYGERIKQARELRGLTQTELAKRIKVTQSRIAQVEGEFREVADSVIAEIAYRTELPISYFSREPENWLSSGSLLFRARTSISKREVTQSLRDAEHVFGLAQTMATNLDIPVLLSTIEGDPRDAAKKTRARLGLSATEPLQNLIRILEGAGVWVLAILAMKGRDAFCCWAAVEGKQIPVIVISPDCPGDRLVMNVAHELGHLVIHKNQLGRLSPELEKEAFAFSAEFLMPEVGIRSDLRAPISLSLAARLKPKWGVSIQALIRRAYDLNVISERQYRYLFMQLSSKGWRTTEPVPLVAEKPRLLRKMAEVLYGTSIPIDHIAADADMLPAEVTRILNLYAQAEKRSDKTQSRVVQFPTQGRNSRLAK